MERNQRTRLMAALLCAGTALAWTGCANSAGSPAAQQGTDTATAQESTAQAAAGQPADAARTEAAASTEQESTAQAAVGQPADTARTAAASTGQESAQQANSGQQTGETTAPESAAQAEEFARTEGNWQLDGEEEIIAMNGSGDFWVFPVNTDPYRGYLETAPEENQYEMYNRSGEWLDTIGFDSATGFSIGDGAFHYERISGFTLPNE